MSTDEAGHNVDLPGDVITVTDLNTDIHNVVKRARRDELDFDFVIGDVSNDGESNGTRYFQLVNDDAGIQCLAFSGTRKSLPKFEEGDRIAVKGRLGYYEARGECSIYVDEVVLVGDSHYHRQIEKTRESLEEDGLFDDDLKQPLPEYPSAVGIVTSKDSDAEEDALNAIRSRHPDVDIYLYNSRVQGIAALEDLCNAITYFDAFNPVEITVVTRGGGSEKDLHAFNTEGVSRTIVNSDTPVVTAIGHENDRPIVDDVADDRAMTPTEIGSVVVPSKQQVMETVGQTRSQVQREFEQAVTTTINTYRTEVETAYDRHTTTTIEALATDVEGAYERVCNEELTALRNDLETAHTVLQQEKEHEEETRELEERTKQYKLAIVAVIILFLLCLFVLLWYLT